MLKILKDRGRDACLPDRGSRASDLLNIEFQVAYGQLHEKPSKCFEVSNVVGCIGSVGCRGTFERLISLPCHIRDIVSVISLYE